MIRRLALGSLAMVSVACNGDAVSAGSNNDTSSTTTNTPTSTTSTTSSATASTASSTSNPTSATGNGGFGPTSVSNGAGAGASDGSITTSDGTTIGGAAGAADGGTGGTGSTSSTTSTTTGGSGGTSEGSFLLLDDCGEADNVCGGNLLHSVWKLEGACVQREAIIGPLQTVCESIEFVSSRGILGGTLTFNTDGGPTYTQNIGYNFEIELEVPADCNLTCATVTSGLAVLGFPGSSCEEQAAGGCHCIAPASGTDARMGEYTATDDGSLTFDYNEGSYCISGDSLTYRMPLQLVPQGTPFDMVFKAVVPM